MALAAERLSNMYAESLLVLPGLQQNGAELVRPNPSPEQEAEIAPWQSASPRFNSSPRTDSAAKKRPGAAEAQGDDNWKSKRRRNEDSLNDKYSIGKGLQLLHHCQSPNVLLSSDRVNYCLTGNTLLLQLGQSLVQAFHESCKTHLDHPAYERS